MAATYWSRGGKFAEQRGGATVRLAKGSGSRNAVRFWCRMAPTRRQRHPLTGALLLGTTGGLLDVVYLNHGHVFANAMTGNVIFLGIAAIIGRNRGEIIPISSPSRTPEGPPASGITGPAEAAKPKVSVKCE
jgi:hypothetical protein